MTANQVSRELSAYHEAGHAVVHVMLGGNFRKATIEPDPETHSLGHVDADLPPASKRQWNRIDYWYQGVDQKQLACKEELWKIREKVEEELIAAMAGSAAVELFTRKRDENAEKNDIGRADMLAHANYENSDQAASAYIEWGRCHAKAMLQREATWEKVEAVANALLQKQTLSYQDVKEIMNEAHRLWQENIIAE